MSNEETMRDAAPVVDEGQVERVAMALCQTALGGKLCPCREIGKFNCADEHPGQMARAAITALSAGGDVVESKE